MEKNGKDDDITKEGDKGDRDDDMAIKSNDDEEHFNLLNEPASWRDHLFKNKLRNGAEKKICQ